MVGLRIKKDAHSDAHKGKFIFKFAVVKLPFQFNS